MLMKIFSNNFFVNFTITKITLLTCLLVLILILITTTIALIYITSIKNKRNTILKNLAYCQNISLKERLKRIN